MDSKDFFEAKEGIKYNLGAGEYVARITNRKTGSHAQFIMQDSLDADFWKLIKKSNTSRLAWASRNSEKKEVAIATFNVPQDKIAYKIVFDHEHRTYIEENTTRPIIKAFSSVEEGKWTVVDNLPEDIKKLFERKVDKLQFYLHQRPNDEGPIGIFR